MKRIDELKERLERVDAQIEEIANAFGSEYVPAELKREQKQLTDDIDELTKTNLSITAAEERTREILKAAGLVASEDGKHWVHPRHADKFLFINKDVDGHGVPHEIETWDDHLEWRFSTQNDGKQSRIYVGLDLPSAGEEPKTVCKTVFIVNWPTSQYPNAEVHTRRDEFEYVLQRLDVLPAEIRNFRKAELKASYDALVRMIAAAGVKTPDIAV